MEFYFMEMIHALQVEHPVTEAITGLDLVEWQLRVAAGEPLPKKQEQLRIQGHAIEARICAESPDNNFLPATGRLDCRALARTCGVQPQRRRRAAHDAAPVRIDSGFGEGDEISPYYDSMIAKLIVQGSTRAQALARLDEALAATHIVGLSTNVQFLRRVPAHRSFAQADLDTALIPREQGRAVPPGAGRAAAGGGGRRGQDTAGRTRAPGRRPVQPARRLALARRGAAAIRIPFPWRAGAGRG
jgi:3-methylcrotonyl-CoA carboxylase alpha subunit